MAATDIRTNSIATWAACPEDRLILCCARSAIDEGTAGRIASLLVEGIDWRRFLDRTFHHRVTPLVHCTLNSLRSEAVPADVMSALAQRCAGIARRNLFLLAELFKLGAWLDTDRIPFVAYKGPALAMLAYGNLALREFGDLDILVEQSHYSKAREAFQRRQYRLTDDWGWECTLVDDQRSISVDIHELLTPRQFPVALRFDDLHGRVVPLPVAGGATRTFCPEDLLIILCIQLAKDTWGPRSVRMSKLCDIAELLRSHPGLDWKAIAARARRAGVARILELGLRAAREHLGAPVDPSQLGMGTARSGALMGHLLARLLNEQGEPASGPLSSARFYFMVRERWRERLYPSYLDFRERLIPNERDRALLPLPKSLDFLYYLIRPFRVCGTYTMAGLKWLKDWSQGRNR